MQLLVMIPPGNESQGSIEGSGRQTMQSNRHFFARGRFVGRCQVVDLSLFVLLKLMQMQRFIMDICS